MVEKESSFHIHTLTVTSFLGGITFAALILLIQSKNDIAIPAGFPNYYLDGLITGTAVSTVFLVISSVGMIRTASGERSPDEPFSDAMSIFGSLGFFGIIALLPFLVLPFSIIGAIIVAMTEAITISIYLRYYLRPKLKD